MLFMDNRQILLAYLIGLIASVLFTWPAGLLMILVISHINGDLRDTTKE